MTESAPESTPSWPMWSPRRIQDWLEHRGGSRPDWPDMSRWSEWPDLFDRWPEFPLASHLKVEEFRDGDDLVVRAEMPGIDPDKDVEITLTDHTIRIRAERREETKSDDKDGYRSEFRYGSFHRSIPLPAGASDSDVKATYIDGILEIRVPVDKEVAEARKVTVARG